MPKSELIISENLSKSFRDNHALVDFSLSVKQGEISGIVGPDGAGKTTAMRILSTVSLPDSGSLFINGVNALTDYRGARKSIGYMSQKFGLYIDMSVEENIHFFADLQGVPKSEINDRKKTLLTASGMYQFRSRLAGRLSGGMKQKLALCCALIHEPKVLILDEPTNGVDPVSRREFWQILNRFASDGTAIVYATSYLDEAERCNTINLMNKGSIIAGGHLEYLQSLPDIDVIEVKGEKVRNIMENIPAKYGKVWSFGSALHIHAPKGRNYAESLKTLLNNNYEISVIPPSLEDIFTYLTYKGDTNE